MSGFKQMRRALFVRRLLGDKPELSERWTLQDAIHHALWRRFLAKRGFSAYQHLNISNRRPGSVIPGRYNTFP